MKSAPLSSFELDDCSLHLVNVLHYIKVMCAYSKESTQLNEAKAKALCHLPTAPTFLIYSSEE